MATFYILPPRPALEELLHAIARQLLPGAPLPQNLWDAFRESLGVEDPAMAHLGASPPVACYIITQDELPEDDGWQETLQQHFGASPEDQVIQSSLPRLMIGRSQTTPPAANNSTPFPSSGTHSTIPLLGLLAGAPVDAGPASPCPSQ